MPVALNSAGLSMRIAAAGLILCAALALVMVAFPPAAFAQQPLRRNLSEELAKSKAERYARIQQNTAAQTANQSDYDAIYYLLDLDIDPTGLTVSGSVEMKLEVLSATLTEVELDLLNNMVVSQAWSGGLAAAHTHVSDLLTVTLDQTYTTGQIVTVKVDYSGTPSPSYGSFGFSSHAGDPMIWSLSEPFGARSWWPCKDIPSDKADSVDVKITVPDTLVVASNGTLVSATDLGATKQYWWQERYPITTYLVSIAIHPYTEFSHWYHYSPTDSMEVQYYVYADHYAAVQTNYAKTVPMIELFAGLFGEYPFLNEKYGHAEFVWGGGMEHQTISSMGGWGEYLIAHELAHMWWGDMITCDDFGHIWLNEGFATYSEALWSEDTYGVASYHSDMAGAKYLGPGTIFVEDTSNFGSIFSSNLSYNKASWVLHMLRHVVGDTTFFDILQAYYSDSRFQYATATTEGFQDVCETVSGMDLDFFFEQWIYQEYYPMYSYEWSAVENGGMFDITLDIDQQQTNHIFKMPIDITVETLSGETTLVVWDSLATQTFALSVVGEPTALHLDKDEWILRTVEEQLANATFHRGVLVVNGVDFNVYGAEIWNAYADSAFWGCYPITFWDCFPETGSGYPSNLPAPLGHGPVPPDTLQQFSTVVWVGNNYNLDILSWYDTPILSFLNVGGNVLLLARMGQDFLSQPMQQYLGITWRESGWNTLGECVAGYPGLVSMTLTGLQSFCAVFDTSLSGAESELLFADTSTFSTDRGLGVWRRPVGGGLHRTDGAQFAFVSGRPYRYDHGQMRDNVEFILGTLFEEPKVPTAAGPEPVRAAFWLGQNYPNPFNPTTVIRFSVAHKGRVSLRVYDVAGRLVRTIVSKEFPPGIHVVTWDGKNARSERVASGVYFYQLTTSTGLSRTRKMVVLK